ncbi:hypothetical protein J1605_022906 [Eschrichtius robustus]|uniref:Small integral membrane protein 40 n=3 Tax=Mysticeti TaxID=9761 RepID=A0AB34H7C2_ESCRO|nr:hypothetical protein J1605_022906 [Eschrichtius robustus]
MAEEEGDVDEEDVFLAFARRPSPPRGPLRQAMDKAFFIFLVLVLTLLTLEAVYKLLWLLPWAKFGDWLLRTPQMEEELELFFSEPPPHIARPQALELLDKAQPPGHQRLRLGNLLQKRKENHPGPTYLVGH